MKEINIYNKDSKQIFIDFKDIILENNIKVKNRTVNPIVFLLETKNIKILSNIWKSLSKEDKNIILKNNHDEILQSVLENNCFSFFNENINDFNLNVCFKNYKTPIGILCEKGLFDLVVKILNSNLALKKENINSFLEITIEKLLETNHLHFIDLIINNINDINFDDFSNGHNILSSVVSKPKLFECFFHKLDQEKKILFINKNKTINEIIKNKELFFKYNSFLKLDSEIILTLYKEDKSFSLLKEFFKNKSNEEKLKFTGISEKGKLSFFELLIKDKQSNLIAEFASFLDCGIKLSINKTVFQYLKEKNLKKAIEELEIKSNLNLHKKEIINYDKEKEKHLFAISKHNFSNSKFEDFVNNPNYNISLSNVLNTKNDDFIYFFIKNKIDLNNLNFEQNKEILSTFNIDFFNKYFNSLNFNVYFDNNTHFIKNYIINVKLDNKNTNFLIRIFNSNPKIIFEKVSLEDKKIIIDLLFETNEKLVMKLGASLSYATVENQEKLNKIIKSQLKKKDENNINPYKVLSFK